MGKLQMKEDLGWRVRVQIWILSIDKWQDGYEVASLNAFCERELYI